MLKTADFDYNLPQELIAQKPTFPRDQCRLLVLDRKNGEIKHRRFFEIVDFLRKGDVLVLNNSKVFKARLYGRIGNYELGVKVEVFLLRALSTIPPLKIRGGEGELCETGSVWEALGNPGRKLKLGVKVYFSVSPLTSTLSPQGRGEVRGMVWCEVIGKNNDKYLVRFNITNDKLMKFVARYGHVPVPPYIKQEPKQFEEYQTVYAKHLGSVAAPTAGFHFTKSLLQKLRRKGIEIHYVTLHVGYGTFKPIKTERIEEHKMEPEWVEISETTAEAIVRAKKEGRRVVAVGTTTVRALEGMYPLPSPLPQGERKQKEIPLPRWEGSKGRVGEVNIFITPGFKFKVIDALITNFHLPKSTLLLLVSAFASPSPNLSPLGRGIKGEGRLRGRDLIITAYQEAIKKKYHFYSFGDAMLIL